MYYGLDDKGEKVHIEDSDKEGTYRCPICDGLLIRRWGDINAHHFAHKSFVCDPWYHDNKGEWHREMQSHFRPEQCEVRIDGGNDFHIADVFIEGKNCNIVIEFQHSPISQAEFDVRNRFYSLNGCRLAADGKTRVMNQVIWVFDCKDKRMFIDTSTKRYGKDERTISAYTDKACMPILERAFSHDTSIRTPVSREITKSLYAHIHWKNPMRIFGNIGTNVLVYFDVKQRQYMTGKKSYYGRDVEWYEYLSEKDNTIDDTMAEFFVFVSYHEPKYISANTHQINRALYNPEYITGRCLLHEEFFEHYTKI